jgi:hypothetical protein
MAGRRIVVCVDCGKRKPNHGNGRCMNCCRVFLRRTNSLSFLKHLYCKLKDRCTNPNNKNSDIYLGMKFCSRKSFLDKFENNFQYLRVYRDWQKSGFNVSKAPSVDRIDPSKGYILSNLRIITLKENALLGHKPKRIQVFNLDGSLVGEFESIKSASKSVGISKCTIHRHMSSLINFPRKYTYKLVG